MMTWHDFGGCALFLAILLFTAWAVSRWGRVRAMRQAATRRAETLEAKPCECTPCPECKGSGIVYFSFGGKHYLGSRRSDDMDEMEPCDNCRAGIVEQCDRCCELEEYDEDERFYA